MDVNGDALQAALARAVMDSVSAEMQKEIFQKALEQHLFSDRSNRDRNESVISHAFKRALDQATHKLAEAVVHHPDNKLRIEAAMQKALEEALEEDRFAELIKNRLVRAFGGY